MNKAVETGWEPEADPEFGQRLIPYLLRRYRWLLAGCIVLGCCAFGIVSLITPAAYSTRGSLHVTKGASTAGMLSGLSLLNGNNSALWDEVLILKSRDRLAGDRRAGPAGRNLRSNLSGRLLAARRGPFQPRPLAIYS